MLPGLSQKNRVNYKSDNFFPKKLCFQLIVVPLWNKFKTVVFLNCNIF